MTLSYRERAGLCRHPLGQKLFRLMEDKQSNLGVAADLTSQHELLKLADCIGPYICVLKTHIDIIEDFDREFIDALQELSEKHQFLLFEDRKFADIGHIVQLQYQKGMYRIAEWAHLTNAHSLLGFGTLQGLKEVGKPLQRGLLLLAQTSAQGNLITSEYTHATVEMAKQHADFILGFITQEKLSDDPGFLHFTPGVHLAAKGDALGQNYNSPELVISERGNDIILVGRGIIQTEDPAQAAMRYRQAGWEAYCQRLNLVSIR